MKKIVSDLLKNRNVEEGLKEYPKNFKKMNCEYAMIRLAMNYYTYYTMVEEDNGLVIDYHKELSTLHQVIEKIFGKNEEVSGEDISKVEDIRKNVINNVQDLTCYVDMFNVYEHALNRVEYRFKDEEIPADYTDEALTKKLMQFILEDEDRMAVNQKISQVIGQLPLRLTKNKFYEMLAQGMSIYQEGTKKSLDDFLYMIKTTSMLEKTDSMQENYPHLEEVFDAFKEVEFKTISSEQYEDMRYNIEKSSEYIEDTMNGYLMLQEIINDLLLVLYTKDSEEENATTAVCEDIIKNTNLLFLQKFPEKSAEEIMDLFVQLEGCQEELYPKLTSFDITDEIQKSYQEKIAELGLSEVYEQVYKLPKLNSDSMFIELDAEDDTEAVSESYVMEQQEALIQAYGELFQNNEKMINRAVMSMALSELPVFFNNISELQDYIYNNLSICTDKAEKLACIEILNGIMEA
ncbi:MAG: hypothetical protein K6G64_08005 [Eubacterium sp.]|nr:hypothetical protein [Eubacterium sp.]